MIIEKMALEELAIFNSSCPSSGIKSFQNAEYLIGCDEKYSDMDFEKFLAGFPEKNLAYHNYRILGQFAKKEKAGKISAPLVRKFFGGSFHVKLILEQLDAINLRQEYKDKYLFAHLLAPILIVKQNPLSGVYRNFGEKVILKNLLIHPKVGKRILKGSEVFCHFSSIISLATPALKRWLLDEQRGSKEFVSAVRRIEEIDYESFRTLGKETINDWTRRFWSECSL